MERGSGRTQMDYRYRERDTEMQPVVVGIPLAMGPGAGTGNGLAGPVPVVAAVVHDERYEGADEFSSPPPIRVWNASDRPGGSSTPNASPPGNNGSRARSESVGTADGRQGSAESAQSPQIRIGIDEVQNLARHFHCTQEQVLSVIHRAKGDRTLVLELLTAREIPPQSQAVRDASRVQIQKRVIQVTRMEVERLSEMFNVPEARVIAVLKQVKGDRDGALAILSNESNVAAAAAAGSKGQGQPAGVRVAAETRSRQLLDRQADEIRSYAEMFGLPQVEVARVWEDVHGNTEHLLSILERLAHGKGGGDEDPQHGSVVRRPNPNPAVGRSAPDVDVIFDDFPAPPNQPARQLPNAPGRNGREHTVSPQGTVMLPELPTDKDL